MKGYQIILLLDGKLHWHWETCSEENAASLLSEARECWRSMIDEGRAVIHTLVIYL